MSLRPASILEKRAGLITHIAEEVQESIAVKAELSRCASEKIDDGVEGFIVRPCDAGSLAQSILILLEDKDRATLMGARGRQRVERDWTAERMAREFEHLFFEVCLPQANRRILAQDLRTDVS